MHVLMLSALEVWALQGQGGAPSLYRTLQAYSQAGHQVTFVCPTIGANAQLPVEGLRCAKPAPPIELPGVTFLRVDVPSLQAARLPLPDFMRTVDQKLRFALLFPSRAAAAARRVFAASKVELLYGYEVDGVLAAQRLRKSQRLPMVARFQGTVLHPHLGSKSALLRRYEEVRAIRASADLYIMTNDGTQGEKVLEKLNPGSQGKVRFWRNGLDVTQLRPASAGERDELRGALDLPRDAFVLLTASRLARWKRVDRAIAAMPRVLRDAPDASLVVVGDGEERPALEAQTTELGVQNAVRFVGAVQQERVADYMRAGDVFVAPADLSNVGNPLLEAMSCGLAIVTVDAGDTGELIRDRETGRLLASGDPRLIADAVAELAHDDALRCALGAAARREAEAKFWTWDERMAAELEAVEALVAPRIPQEVP